MRQNNHNTKTKKYKHINYVERTQIERWHNKDKRSNVEIAMLLKKSERTIRREIKRGKVRNLTSELVEIYVYSADIAEQKYRYEMTGKGQELKIGKDYSLKKYIENGIKKERKSPEILVKEIKIKKLDFVSICAKTVRNAIKAGTIFDIKQKDMIYKKVHKEKNAEKRVCMKVPAEKSIEFRTKEANTREEYGHWEGDLVIGQKNRGAVLFTLTERKTREEIIIKLANKKNTEVVKALDLLEQRYKRSFSKKFKTITFDNGGEFRKYEEIERSCLGERKRTTVYYAHPYCSGERGSNENSNRLIRRFIPKGTNITKITKKFIKWIERWINTLPRAMFNYKCALEMR